MTTAASECPDCDYSRPGFIALCWVHWHRMEVKLFLNEWRRWGWPDYRDPWEGRAAEQMRFWFMRASF